MFLSDKFKIIKKKVVFFFDEMSEMSKYDDYTGTDQKHTFFFS